MKYISVCSGIEAASIAWEGLGWQPLLYSEIEPFCNTLLQQRYPAVPNMGDFTKIGGNEFGSAKLLVGGTPCQSFSVAGHRLGLDDPRGNLSLEFLRLAYRAKVTWFVWENVPGVLSASRGEDFATFLSAATRTYVRRPPEGWKSAGVVQSKSKTSFSVCWRVLDAQFFGVPQRRRRVITVGYLGDWRPAVAALLEPQSLRGDTAPRRKASKGVAAALRGGAQVSGNHVTHTLSSEGADASEDGTGRGLPMVTEFPVPANPLSTAHAVTEDGRGRGLPIIAQAPVSFKRRGGYGYTQSEDMTSTLESQGGTHQGGPDNLPMVLVENQRDEVRLMGGDGQITGALPADPGLKNSNMLLEPAHALQARTWSSHREDSDTFIPEVTDDLASSVNARDSRGPGSYWPNGGLQAASIVHGRVRRLSVLECERLQGLPDGWTAIEVKGKPASNSARYKAIGNSMAVPVMRWVGERINAVERILKENR